jgi:hypothetical protein
MRVVVLMAPFCAVDSTGRLECIYFDVASCRQIGHTMGGMCVATPRYGR